MKRRRPIILILKMLVFVPSFITQMALSFSSPCIILYINKYINLLTCIYKFWNACANQAIFTVTTSRIPKTPRSLSNFRGSSSSLYRCRHVVSARARDANARWSFFRRDRFHQRNTSSFLPSYRRLDSRVTSSCASATTRRSGQSRLPRAAARFEFIYCINRPSLTHGPWLVVPIGFPFANDATCWWR